MLSYKEQKNQAFYGGVVGTALGAILLIIGMFMDTGTYQIIVTLTGLVLILICGLVASSIVEGMILSSIVNDTVNGTITDENK